MTEQTKLVPKRRFIEFQNTKAWEQHKLKDIADSIGTGKSTFVKNVYSTDNPYAILGSTSIIGYDSEFDYEGDFILTARVGENAGNLYRFSGKAKITDNTVFIKGENLEFLYPLFNHINLKKLSFGTGQPLIKASELKNIQLQIPTFQEKSKIGLFFRHLDDLILLQQRKLEKTKALKAAYLSEMFPAEDELSPKRRFAGFTQAWKKRKLGEITDSFSGGTPSVNNRDYYNGNIPFIRSGEINSNTTELFINDNAMNNSSAKLVAEGDILYALYGATSGEVGISQINGAINQAVLAIKPKFGDDSYLITQWLKKQKQVILSTYLQGGQGNLSGNIVKNLIIDLPTNKEEQAKIGSFFKQLDKIIAYHQCKLDKLQNLKNAYLHEMFV